MNAGQRPARGCSFLLTSEEKEPKKTATPKPLQRGFSLFRGKTLSIKVLVWLSSLCPPLTLRIRHNCLLGPNAQHRWGSIPHCSIEQKLDFRNHLFPSIAKRGHTWKKDASPCIKQHLIRQWPCIHRYGITPRSDTSSNPQWRILNDNRLRGR